MLLDDTSKHTFIPLRYLLWTKRQKLLKQSQTQANNQQNKHISYFVNLTWKTTRNNLNEGANSLQKKKAQL